MSEITPKSIIERHNKYPDATIRLIEAYAHKEYQKAIRDLFKLGRLVAVEDSDTALIVITKTNLEAWRSMELSHWVINGEHSKT